MLLYWNLREECGTFSYFLKENMSHHKSQDVIFLEEFRDVGFYEVYGIFHF
jgi:hypothetical protein